MAVCKMALETSVAWWWGWNSWNISKNRLLTTLENFIVWVKGI
jgi:hypothetical protein